MFEKIKFQTYQDKKCPICLNEKLIKFKVNAYDSTNNEKVDIVECHTCNFAWQYPLKRTPKESVCHFDQQYKDAGKTRSQYYNPELKKEIANIQLEYLSSLIEKPGRLLDIGAGSGNFALAAAEKGWTATALDPALQVGTTSNINYVRGTMDDLDTNQKYDAITFWDVIEHVPDPLELIFSAMNLLKKNGWLVIETGNYQSLQRINARENHWIYQLDHKWYFSPDHLKKILCGMGLSEINMPQVVLRPRKKVRKKIEPSIVKTVKETIKDPLGFTKHLDKYYQLKRVEKRKMSDVSIFTISGKYS